MPEFVADRHQCPHCDREFWSASAESVPYYCPYCGANASIGYSLLWYEHVGHIREQQHPELDSLSTVKAAMEDVMLEYHRASDRFPRFHSAHEGWAILNEEVDELWEEVKKPPKAIDPNAMRREAIQVAAMGLRFVLDICPDC